MIRGLETWQPSYLAWKPPGVSIKKKLGKPTIWISSTEICSRQQLELLRRKHDKRDLIGCRSYNTGVVFNVCNGHLSFLADRWFLTTQLEASSDRNFILRAP
jgi:hypothetical protein